VKNNKFWLNSNIKIVVIVNISIKKNSQIYRPVLGWPAATKALHNINGLAMPPFGDSLINDRIKGEKFIFT